MSIWLGILLVVRRTDQGIRRVGVSLLAHGLAFNVDMYEGVLDGGSTHRGLAFALLK